MEAAFARLCQKPTGSLVALQNKNLAQNACRRNNDENYGAHRSLGTGFPRSLLYVCCFCWGQRLMVFDACSTARAWTARLGQDEGKWHQCLRCQGRIGAESARCFAIKQDPVWSVGRYGIMSTYRFAQCAHLKLCLRFRRTRSCLTALAV